MKILHILTSINTGGAEKFCLDICNTQAEVTDNDIYLCVLDEITDNQPLIKMLSPQVKLISLQKKGGYNLKIIYKIYKLLTRVNPDIIHLNGRALVYSSLAILVLKIPSVYTVHTMADKEYNSFIIKYNKFLFNYFTKLFMPVSISNSVMKTVQSTYGNIFKDIIYNGSSKLIVTKRKKLVSDFIKSIKSDNETLVFMYIGRIRNVKNTLLLIQAFNMVLGDNKNVCLCIIGYDGSKNHMYLSECENANKYTNRIKFVGRKENIADYLLCADAMCLTSTYEGLGIVALEAFSMGVPVLSTPSGGPSELIVPHVNGYVSEYVTVSSYVEILNKFISKPLKDKKNIQDIYERNYTMTVCASKYLALYERKVHEIK